MKHPSGHAGVAVSTSVIVRPRETEFSSVATSHHSNNVSFKIFASSVLKALGWFYLHILFIILTSVTEERGHWLGSKMGGVTGVLARSVSN